MIKCGGRILGGILIVLLLLTAGCTYVQRGAAVGAGGGAIVGGVLASTQGILSAGEGAAVGACAGGLAGALIGEQFEKKKMDELKAEIENLKSQIAAKEDLVSQKDAAMMQMKNDLAQKEKELSDLLQNVTDMNNKLSAKDREMAQMKQDYDTKLKDLKSMEDKLKELEVQLQQTPKGIELTIVNELLFASGSDEITSRGLTLLNQVAQIVKDHFPNKSIMVEGHTDTQEIQHSGWKSNWELGAHRSLAVLHNLVDNHNFNPANMSAITYSKYHPVADNSTEEGRSQNRRAVILILPEVEQSYKQFAAE